MRRRSLKTDVLIIGSGPIGATFARFLTTNGRKVTMLEMGPYLTKRPGEHLANAFKFQHQPNLFTSFVQSDLIPFSIDPSEGEKLQTDVGEPDRVNFQNPEQDKQFNMPGAAASYAVGGMFTHWSAVAPDPTPMERTPLISSKEWDPLLSIARTLFNVHTDAFEPSFSNHVLKKAFQAHGIPADVLPLGAQKRDATNDLTHLVTWTGTDTVLGPLVDSPGKFRGKFRLRDQHLVEELVLDGHRVSYAVVRDMRDFTTRRIYADTFVVAGGPFLTPRLLWQSGIRHDALGRFLNENPVAGARVALSEEILSEIRKLPDNPAHEDPIPIPWNDPEPFLGFSPTPDKPWHAQIHRAGRFQDYNPEQDVRLLIDLIYFGMVEPKPDNRITFSEDYTDRFGMPQITIHYQLSEHDQKQVDAMVADLTKATRVVGSTDPKSGGVPPLVASPGSSLHLQGTYRMGGDRNQDTATSVVDTHSRVWDVDNLYLGGLGVIPNKMANNPTLTACAFAVRAVSQMLGLPLTELAKQVGAS